MLLPSAGKQCATPREKIQHAQKHPAPHGLYSTNCPAIARAHPNLKTTHTPCAACAAQSCLLHSLHSWTQLQQLNTLAAQTHATKTARLLPLQCASSPGTCSARPAGPAAKAAGPRTQMRLGSRGNLATLPRHVVHYTVTFCLVRIAASSSCSVTGGSSMGGVRGAADAAAAACAAAFARADSRRTGACASSGAAGSALSAATAAAEAAASEQQHARQVSARARIVQQH